MKTFFLTISVAALMPFGLSSSLLAQSGPPTPPAPPTPTPHSSPSPRTIPPNAPLVQPDGPRGGSNLSTDLKIDNPDALDLTPQVVNYYNTVVNTNATPAEVREGTRDLVASNIPQASLIVGNALANAPTQDIAVAVAEGAMEGIPATQAAVLAGGTIARVFPEFAPAVAETMVSAVSGVENKVAVAAAILSHLPFNHSRYQDVITSTLSALKSDALVLQAIQKAIIENPAFSSTILKAASEAFPQLKQKIEALKNS